MQESVEHGMEVSSERQQPSASTFGMESSRRLLLAYRFSAVLKAVLRESVRRAIPNNEQKDGDLLFNGHPSSRSEKTPPFQDPTQSAEGEHVHP